ncbi:MAG: NfeD family protein [Hyphomicrobiaceae bacterium]
MLRRDRRPEAKLTGSHMQSLIDLLLSLGPWNWFLLGLLLFVLETVIPGVQFIWFGAAASAVGLLMLAAGAVAPFAVPIGVQLVLFAALSAATIWWMRRYGNRASAPSDVPDLNARANQYVGRRVTVVEAFRDGRGRVRVGDTVWAAEGPDLAEGAHARVVGVNGTLLKVEAG